MMRTFIAVFILSASTAFAGEPDPIDELIEAADKPPPEPKKRKDGADAELAVDPIWRGLNAPDGAQSTRVGVGFGIAAYDGSYLVADPFFELKTSYVRLALGAPIRLTLNDPNNPGQKWSPRKQDWDEFRDYFKLVRELRIGGDANYGKLGRFFDMSLGHGGLVRRYNPNIFLNTPHLGLHGRYESDWFAGEVALSDVTFQAPVTMVRLQFRPWEDSSTLQLSSLHLGVSYVADFTAPNGLRTNDIGLTAFDSSGIPRSSTRMLHAFSADLGLTAVDLGIFAVGVYGEFNQFLAAGNGIHGGVDMTLKASIVTIKAKAEYRNLGRSYMASYFDAYYDVQRYQLLNLPGTELADSKQVYLRNSMPAARGHGGLFELGIDIGGYFALAAATEISSRTGVPEQSFLLHMAITPASWLQIFATAQQRGSDGIFKPGAISGVALVALGLRLQPADWIAFNGQIARLFTWSGTQTCDAETCDTIANNGGFNGVVTAGLNVELFWSL